MSKTERLCILDQYISLVNKKTDAMTDASMKHTYNISIPMTNIAEKNYTRSHSTLCHLYF